MRIASTLITLINYTSLIDSSYLLKNITNILIYNEPNYLYLMGNWAQNAANGSSTESSPERLPNG